MLVLGDETINDFAGGSNFLILALVTLNLGGTYYARNIIVSVLVMVGKISRIRESRAMETDFIGVGNTISPVPSHPCD
jgi:hypothetical protein